MEPAVSRGETPLNVKSWPQAAVLIAGVIAVGGVVVCLANAGWDGQTITAFAALALGVITGQGVMAHRSSVVEAKTDQQTEQLATIARQTNGELKAAVRGAVRAELDAAGITNPEGKTVDNAR